jgi:transcriptional regulator with XRE-family HTH domain
VESELKKVIQRVKQWRLERGLSQEQFAEMAGLDPKHYQHIEAFRKVDYRVSTLEKLAKGCGVKVWELVQPDFDAMVADKDQAKYGPAPTTRKRKKRGK